MKTVLVTVNEFINNGGALIAGRRIYDTHGKELGKFVEFDKIGCVKVDILKGSFGTCVTSVKIDCTPIYI